jgi:signal transduction histidine kinase
MTERAQAVGGHLDIDTKSGTSIHFRLPLVPAP